MADKSITYPPLVVLSGNETLLRAGVTSAYNSLGTSVRAKIELMAFHLVNDSISLSWNGNIATFTCVNPFNGALGTYPLRTTETLQQWGDKIVTAFMSNYQLANDYVITGNYAFGKYTIYFDPYNKTSAYNLSITISSSAQHSSTNSSYTPDDLYTDFRLRIQLFQDVFLLGGPKTKYRSPVTIPFIFSGRDASLTYDLSRLLYSDQTGHFTFPSTAVRHLHTFLKRIYIQVSFLADNITPESLPIENYVYVLPGRVSDTKVKALNTQQTSIYADLVSSKRFLTFAPLNKETDIYAPEKLYFLFTAAYTGAKLRITERFTNSPAESRDLDVFNTSEFNLHEFSVGFQNIKQQDYGAKVLSNYDIWLQDSIGNLISEVRTFTLDYSYRRHARYFLFLNSFGVYELFRSTGDAEKVNKTDREFYNRVIYAQKDSDQSRKAIQVNHTYQMKVNTGLLQAPLNFYYAHEFLGSPDVFWLKNDRPYAVQIEAQDAALSASDLANLHDFDFTVTLDDLDDSFFQEFQPGSELPVHGDFSNDFSDDFNV